MLGAIPIDSAFGAQLRPGISVLIRTYNSACTLERVLEKLSLGELDELIVVDSGSTDSTIRIAQLHQANIIRLDRPFNYSAALNRGFEKAKNEWVLVLSSHSIPQCPQLIERVRSFAVFASVNFVVGYGICDYAAPSATAPSGQVTAYSQKEFQSLHVSEIGGNGLAVYRRAAWLQHNFDEAIVTAEDLEWFLWARSKGYKAARIVGAHATYRNQGSLTHMFRKGWNEVKQAKMLLPGQREGLVCNCRGYILGNLHFLRLAVERRLPLASMLRQQSHLLGAFLARLCFR